MPGTYYLDKIYPLQDKILNIDEQLELDFYLTGDTALGRCYLNHRYSDELDFFVNRHKQFRKPCTRAIDALKKNGYVTSLQHPIHLFGSLLKQMKLK